MARSSISAAVRQVDARSSTSRSAGWHESPLACRHDISVRYINAIHRRRPRPAWRCRPPVGHRSGGSVRGRGQCRTAPEGLPLVCVSFRPGALEGVQTSPTGGRVEYLLARNAVVREYRKGRLSRLDVCDAHPELLRVARNLGRPSGEQCPICEESRPGRGDLRVRLAAAPGGPVRGHPGRAHPLLAPQGAGGLLRDRGLHGVLVEPPGPDVPGRRRGGGRGPEAAAAVGPACSRPGRPAPGQPGDRMDAGPPDSV